jgi:hypothetical protein
MAAKGSRYGSLLPENISIKGWRLSSVPCTGACLDGWRSRTGSKPAQIVNRVSVRFAVCMFHRSSELRRAEVR